VPDDALLGEIEDVRRVVGLGHQARQAAGFKVQQPLRALVVEGAASAASHADEIRDELRVKDVRFEPVDAELVVKPNLPVLGPKLGPALGAVRAALGAGDFEQLGEGRFRVGEHDVLRRRAARVLVEAGEHVGEPQRGAYDGRLRRPLESQPVRRPCRLGQAPPPDGDDNDDADHRRDDHLQRGGLRDLTLAQCLSETARQRWQGEHPQDGRADGEPAWQAPLLLVAGVLVALAVGLEFLARQFGNRPARDFPGLFVKQRLVRSD